ncbi:hypothetical protein OAN307_c18550 [Octadecabacter antarcticus 307]|uniref:Uncharacterized protein n=1 Tax=Octadecabacter antarcticus 307 TaxID=391626 RepID=M9R4I1_9RHOB|nr:hypothetical protein OAN307_c18550 [Octadecabacter antarcticus 307]
MYWDKSTSLFVNYEMKLQASDMGRLCSGWQGVQSPSQP